LFAGYTPLFTHQNAYTGFRQLPGSGNAYYSGTNNYHIRLPLHGIIKGNRGCVRKYHCFVDQIAAADCTETVDKAARTLLTCG
jgi:hypothetical protein